MTYAEILATMTVLDDGRMIPTLSGWYWVTDPDGRTYTALLQQGSRRLYMGWQPIDYWVGRGLGFLPCPNPFEHPDVGNPISEAPTLPMTYADQMQMLLAVHAAVRIEGSQKAAAKRFGISESYLSDILRANREVPDLVARFFGMRRTVVYLPADDLLNRHEGCRHPRSSSSSGRRWWRREVDG